jgi:hypothetical protein
LHITRIAFWKDVASLLRWPSQAPHETEYYRDSTVGWVTFGFVVVILLAIDHLAHRGAREKSRLPLAKKGMMRVI